MVVVTSHIAWIRVMTLAMMGAMVTIVLAMMMQMMAVTITLIRTEVMALAQYCLWHEQQQWQ